MPGLQEPEAGPGAEDPGAGAGSDTTEALDTGAPGTEALDAAFPFALEPDPDPDAGPDPAGAGRAGPRDRSFRHGRMVFRHWRRTRAFWGGFLLVLSGSEILYTYNAPFKVVIHFGLYGIAGFALPGLVLLLGLLVWFDPEHRVFYSILALAASAGTWLTSNLGGFFIGMLLGLTGATLTYGWSDAPIPAKKAKEPGKSKVREAGTGS